MIYRIQGVTKKPVEGLTLLTTEGKTFRGYKNFKDRAEAMEWYPGGLIHFESSHGCFVIAYGEIYD